MAEHHSTPETVSEPGRDACGLGFLARLDGRPDGSILPRALGALARLEHRGAVGSDGRSGDGSGITTQIPHRLVGRWLGELGVTDPPENLAVGMLFLPPDEPSRARGEGMVVEELEREGFRAVAWRDVPHNEGEVGPLAHTTMPAFRQVFAADTRDRTDPLEAERALYIARRRLQRRLSRELDPERAYACSLSTRTIVYKGLCRAATLPKLYPDLTDPDYETAAAVFHRRFSTNTAPAWPLVQPLRMCAHNGEFNTLQGNVSWLRAREPRLESPLFGDAVRDLVPLADPRDSDSVTFDRVFEILVMAGREPETVMTMLCPEPYTHMPDMDPAVRAMCRYHSELIEPWDGPAAVVFFDGRTVGAGLDRNGLRPFRYVITEDGLVVGGSEAGLVEFDERRIVEKGRLGPGGAIAVDLDCGGVRRNEEIKRRAASARPYLHWVDQGVRDLPTGTNDLGWMPAAEADLVRRQLAFGYAREDIERIISPMWSERTTPVGSMGDDTPLAALSDRPQLLYRFFKQRFAQVTNPALDSVRERINMSLETSLGRYSNILDDSPEAVRLLRLDSPVISEHELQRLCVASGTGDGAATFPAVYEAGAGPDAFGRALESLCDRVVEAVRSGVRLVILSDRAVDQTRAPLPMLLAVSAVHHRLVAQGIRLDCSIVSDTAEAREDHHFACLIGFGATLVLPHLAFETIRELAAPEHLDEALAGYRKAVETGLLKILSKMGVTVIQSYRGARLFEIVGLAREVVDRYFPLTPAPAAGIGLAEIEAFQAAHHTAAYGEDAPRLTEAGTYRFRKGGERHAHAPETFKLLHKAVRTEDPETFRKFAEASTDRPAIRPRDLLVWRPLRDPVPLDEVEPVSTILARFCSQAMSHGAISREAHELIAVAGNRLGVRSNSGEGGEAAERFTQYTVNGNAPTNHLAPWKPEPGDLGNSPVKQVAAGRFGVSASYLASASELEIKVAQGAKPGEGGQIPGFKVTEEIAALRHTLPGTPLISPPPHHDIYSIEDLAQLIHDLKRVNPRASVAVKLVASSGVGTIACGVAKAGADCIGISGADGGTGAAALSSIKHAGLPWEFGLARAQHALAANGLRDRVRLRVDGGLTTGRDVVLAAMLGADETGFGTVMLLAAGCIMARRCHDNSCPVGVATQDPKLRAKFPGRPEHVLAYFSFVAEEVRHHLAALGARSLDELVGRTDLLSQAEEQARPESRRLSLAEVLAIAPAEIERPRRWAGCRNPTRPENGSLDDALLYASTDAINGVADVEPHFPIRNDDLSVGARLAGEIGRRRNAGVGPIREIRATFTGSAGQSFGAFCADPIQLMLLGDAQDGVGKSMSGGRIVVRPEGRVGFDPHRAVIAGNTLLYGAIGGEAYFAGAVGERFAVRNSGATVVAEGCGDHGCEYMTGGRAVILGSVGRNFGAGMTGGVAWVLDEDGYLERHCNTETVVIRCLTPGPLADELRDLVTRHARWTASAFAGALLADWDAWMPRFCAVAPAASLDGRRPPAEVNVVRAREMRRA